MLDEALEYFGEETAFRRLFTLFKKKYESLGRMGGTVKIDRFSGNELDAIARFFGMTPDDIKQKGKVSLESFEAQLHSTKFASISLKDLLEAYFKEPLSTNKERKDLQEKQLQQFLDQLENQFPKLKFWIAYLRKKTPDTYWIYRLIEDRTNDFVMMVQHLNDGFCYLPDHFERLPMYSQRTTSNPHQFDLNTNAGKLFIHLLSVHRAKNHPVTVPSDTEGINDLLLGYSILRDDITNYVTCANLLAETSEGVHPMWEAAASNHSVMNTPLRELMGLLKVYPKQGNKKVWIVENSGVYSSILDQLPNVPLICTHGQFKLAALILIDLLVKEACDLYYAGDFDPEGLSMAERLYERHPNHVHLWKMDVPDYKKSNADMELSEKRLSKLESISTPDLIPVVKLLRTKKKAGYQEALVDEMIQELVEEMNY